MAVITKIVLQWSGKTEFNLQKVNHGGINLLTIQHDGSIENFCKGYQDVIYSLFDMTADQFNRTHPNAIPIKGSDVNLNWAQIVSREDKEIVEEG